MTTPAATAHLAAIARVLRQAALDTDWINDALVLARLFGRLHWDNISGQFSDEPFEAALCDRWGAQIAAEAQTALPQVPPLDVLHVTTQVYDGGGHSRLLRQLVAALGGLGTRQGLMLTGKGTSRPSGLPDHIAVASGRPSQRAAQIVACGRRAGAVLLHHHPDDIATALAARILRAEGIRVLFVNHADHVFSFGPGAADAVLEICNSGWKTTAAHRAAHGQSFMGIPVLSADAVLPDALPPRDGPIVSMGGPGKFHPYPGLSFPDFLIDLLARVPNDVVLIGPTAADPWWQEVLRAYPERVQLRGVLPPAEVADILRGAACYIDSFPMDGGTAFPQSVCQGPPGFGPNAQDALGASPADALRFDTVAEMTGAVVAYLQGGAYPFDLAAVRGQVLQGFSDRAVADRVARALQDDLTPMPEELAALGRRAPDYNARRWVEAGQVHLPKRIWRQLSLSARRDLARGFVAAGLPDAMTRVLRRRLITG